MRTAEGLTVAAAPNGEDGQAKDQDLEFVPVSEVRGSLVEIEMVNSFTPRVLQNSAQPRVANASRPPTIHRPDLGR